MADSPSTTTATKHYSTTKSEAKPSFSLLTARKTMSFAYAFTFVFVACAVFLVFNPYGYSSPWLNNFFRTTSSTNSSYRSHFSSIFSHFFPNSSQISYGSPPFTQPPNDSFQFFGKEEGFLGRNGESKSEGANISVGNQTGNSHSSHSLPTPTVSLSQQSNHTSQNPTFQFSQEKEFPGGATEKSKKNSSFSESSKFNITNQPVSSQSFSRDSRKVNPGKNQTMDVLQMNGTEKGVVEKDGVSANAALVSKGGDGNGNGEDFSLMGREENWLEKMSHCNIFDGRWVRDDSYPLYAPGSCPHIDEPFNCFLNSRPDSGYENYRWQPKDCNIPRLNGKHMLELLRGKRLVFVGDSLNRNMWESLVCVLRNSVEDKSRVFEGSGRREFRTEGSYSFIFNDHNCSVEFFRSPFLVQEWEMPDINGSKKETLRLDVIERSSDKYKTADILVFNTGHWWTHEKTSKGKGYYQEGSHIYGELNVKVAFRKALMTWARWVDANVDPTKTLVLFRGYSTSHFRGGRWNSGGQCNRETEPIKNVTYLSKYPSKMRILELVMKGMKTPVFYLNITRMTDFRKDAHPSIYRKQNLTEEERRSPLKFQDCSHWCLPGVPDAWNELVYAQLLIQHSQKQQQLQLQEELRRRP